MSIEFKLPNLGEGVTSADVAEIRVQAGDSVTSGQAILEVETDKAVVEVPIDRAGVIVKLLVKVGDKIQVGQALVELDGAAAAPTAATPKNSPASAKPQTAPAAKPTPAAPVPAGSATAVTFEFKLPNLGEGVTQADVAEVLVKEGDVVTVGQPLLEVETEKAVAEIPSDFAGQVTRVLVKEGDVVKVGQHLLTVRTAGAESSVGAPTPAPATPRSPAEPGGARSPSVDIRSPIMTTAVSVSSHAANGAGSDADQGHPLPASPATRRLARELGVELRLVQGSGSGGRISQGDVQQYVRGRLQGLTTVPTRSAGSASAGGLIAPPPLPDFTRFGVITREPMNKISRTAAENLTVAWSVIPHVTQHDRADITDLEAARKRFADGVGSKGPKVTMTAIVMKALTRCLQAFPKFNSSLDPETFEIVLKHYYSIGCAVDTPHGLLVPVVKECDKKTILEIAAELTELAGKAREKKLSIDSMQGATCTVTNLGGIGGVGFTPIVNYPEVCILGMSRGQTELKLVNGQVVERLMLPLSLSYDHRVINGADAARFVSALCNLLSDPFQLLTSC